MDKSHGNCECCEKWYKKHIVLKRKLAETSLQIGRFLQLDQENKKLKDKLRDMHELSQTLRADCAGYQKDMCATLAELNSLKQLSSSQCAELARLNQERDEAYQAHQVAQTSLHSCQAALKQYEALIQQQQKEAKSKAWPRSKTQENRVSVLEKKLQAYTQQVKQARSQRKKAMGWLRGFVELLGHPESWTSAKLRLQVERLSTLVHAEESPGLKPLANHSKSSHVVGTTNNKLLKRSSGLEQHLCVQQMEERQAGREQQRCISRIGGAGAVTRLSEEQSAGPNMKACKPLTDRSNVQHERLALEGEPPLEAVQKVAKGMDTGLSLCPMREQQSSPEVLVHEGQHAPVPCSTPRQQEQDLESMVEVLPKRKQWLARKRQSPDPLSASERKRALHGTGEDQQLMNPQLKQGGHEQEQPQDSKKRLAEVQDYAPTGKKPRLSKRQLRELFSSSSEEDEASVAEESAYTTFLLSAEHKVLSRTASGRLLAAKTAHTAMSKLSWLAVQPEVRPGVVASFVRNVKRDALVYAALLYLGRCKANPVAAYCRGEQAPPLITKLEMLLIEAVALKPDGFAALLSSLRARLWSPRKPTRMLAQASYVRLLCAVCSQLKEHKVARVAIWDLVCSDHAPFLVASAVGAWPGLLSALPPGPLQRAVSYILLHSPAHSLNSTLMSQAHKVLCELGPLEEFVGDEQTLVNELLGPLLPPHRRCGDVCMTHRLALEQLCRRSPVDLLAWLLEQRLGPHLQSVLDQPHAACLVRLLGSLWKHYEKAAIKLENLLSQLESFLCHGEPAMQGAIVQALLLLPGLKGSRSAGALIHWQQQQPS
ncbi:uncharacterized protein LOC142571328 isoform X6 [Dermacentor variabilis]|uniref:uncharacterized protein LOC142571328 isoform X6 n=1 Tax=Dermacentor variabilis TaxID=34621 RepID=UPI003F5B71CE